MIWILIYLFLKRIRGDIGWFSRNCGGTFRKKDQNVQNDLLIYFLMCYKRERNFDSYNQINKLQKKRMFRSTILTIALLATATQAINLRQETKADIGTSDSPSTNEDPTATWAFTKTGNLNLVNTMLDGTDGENANNDSSNVEGNRVTESDYHEEDYDEEVAPTDPVVAPTNSTVTDTDPVVTPTAYDFDEPTPETAAA